VYQGGRLLADCEPSADLELYRRAAPRYGKQQDFARALQATQPFIEKELSEDWERQFAGAAPRRPPGLDVEIMVAEQRRR
jgi:hypothetical protein